MCLLLLLRMLSGYGSPCTVEPGVPGTCAGGEDCWTNAIPFSCANGLSCCPAQTYYRTPIAPAKMQQFPCGETPMLHWARVVGGRPIEANVYSWTASLEYGNKKNSFGVCAGSVISSLYVVTAAHCVVGSGVERHGAVTAVRLGDFEREHPCDYGASGCEFYQRFAIVDKIVHPEFKKDQFQVLFNDIALLKLDREIQFTKDLRPICLPIGVTEPLEDSFVIAGWGRTMTPTDHPEKRAAQISVMNDEKCKTNGTFHICAGDMGINTCSGDSGGPLMGTSDFPMVLEGIASQGFQDCTTIPSIFTRVRYFLPWIQQYVKLPNSN